MTKIKLCGLTRPCDIEYANELEPEYIGFVFAKKSKRYISPEGAGELRKQLKDSITPVGVFVDEEIESIIYLLENDIISVVQLHGNENEEYISLLRKKTDCKIIKAFCIKSEDDIIAAVNSTADYVLLDSKGGSGTTFDWSLIRNIKREYFLAGGLTPDNLQAAISELDPYAVDASSSLEENGFKDKNKMTAFVNAVRLRKD